MELPDITGLTESRRALQADLCIDQAIAVTRDLAAKMASPPPPGIFPNARPDDQALDVRPAYRKGRNSPMAYPAALAEVHTGHQTNDGVHYPEKKKLALEGTAKSSQILIEIPKIAQ